MCDLVGSIVVHKNSTEHLRRAIASFLSARLNVKLYVVDNSPDDSARALCGDSRITYIRNERNLGFGAGHNIALRESLRTVAYHVVLNPDIYFDSGTLEQLIEFVEGRPDVGLLMPKVLSPDGSIQYLCKRLPTPGDLILRRFLPGPLKTLVRKRLARYELRDEDYTKTMLVPVLSGCFMMMSCSALAQVGLFDERFFMYLEDVDLCRRIGQRFKAIYYPEVVVYHYHGRGSYRKLLPLIHHIVSAVRYFQKWGWFSDTERVCLNQRTSSGGAETQTMTG